MLTRKVYNLTLNKDQLLIKNYYHCEPALKQLVCLKRSQISAQSINCESQRTAGQLRQPHLRLQPATQQPQPTSTSSLATQLHRKSTARCAMKDHEKLGSRELYIRPHRGCQDRTRYLIINFIRENQSLIDLSRKTQSYVETR